MNEGVFKMGARHNRDAFEWARDEINKTTLWCAVEGFTGCKATHLGLDGRPYCDTPGHDPDRASR